MPELIVVVDPRDPRLSAYRDVRERDLVGRDGLFIAEGEVVVRTLLTAARGHAPVSLLLAATRLQAQTALLAAAPTDLPVYVATRPVMDAVVGFAIHRGILALGRRAPPLDPGSLLAGCAEQALVIGLVGLGNHDNVGGVLRNAAAFGAAAVLLDAGCCDPLYRKAIRVSAGAALRVPFARLTPGADLPGLLSAHGFEAIGLSPSGQTELHAVQSNGRTAALFGAEGPGLPPQMLDRVRSVRITMSPGVDSLNVATASGIVLHHLARGRGP